MAVKPTYDSYRSKASASAHQARYGTKYSGAAMGDALENARDKIRNTWDNLPPKGKIAGGVAGGVAAGGVALAALLSPQAANVTLSDLESGEYNMDSSNTLLVDKQGHPSLLSYLDPNLVSESQVVKVSLATQLPDAFRSGNAVGNYMDGVRMNARSHTTRTETYYTTVCTGSGDTRSCHQQANTRIVTDHHYYSYNLDIEQDFRPVNSEQERLLRDYLKDFTAATGIRFEISHNNPDADITVANFINQPDSYRGSLDYAGSTSEVSFPPSSVNAPGPKFGNGFLLLNERNGGYDNNLLSQFPKALGFAGGTENMKVLRDKLEKAGRIIPKLGTGDDIYHLDQPVNSPSDLLPDNVIFDQGGINTLVGSPKDDVIFSEAGYCGRTGTPTRWVTNVFGDGDKYCIADGEFSFVKSGKGNDLIVAPRGAGQVIEPGAGDDRVMVFTPEIGALTVLSERSGGKKDSTDRLVLSEELMQRYHVQVAADGDDLVLSFHAPSDRLLGTLHLKNQLADHGIQELQVVDRKGDVIWEHDVQGVNDVAAWQKDVIDPIEAKMEERSLEELRKEAKKTREGALGRLETERESPVTSSGRG